MQVAPAAAVDRPPHAERFVQRHRFPAAGNAVEVDLGAPHVGRLPHDPLGAAVRQVAELLGGADRHLEVLRQADVGLDVVLRHRALEPEEIEFGDLPADVEHPARSCRCRPGRASGRCRRRRARGPPRRPRRRAWERPGCAAPAPSSPGRTTCRRESCRRCIPSSRTPRRGRRKPPGVPCWGRSWRSTSACRGSRRAACAPAARGSGRRNPKAACRGACRRRSAARTARGPSGRGRWRGPRSRPRHPGRRAAALT